MKALPILIAAIVSTSAHASATSEVCIYFQQEVRGDQSKTSAWLTCGNKSGDKLEVRDDEGAVAAKARHLTQLLQKGYKIVNCSLVIAQNYAVNECILSK